MARTGSRRTLSSGTIAVVDLFLVLGLLGTYLKLALLNQQWDAVARFLGRVQAGELGVLDRLAFFFNDIALNLLVIPLVGAGVTSLVFRRYRVWAALVLTTTLALAYFVELRAQQQVGQYVSRDALRDLIGWAAMHPGMGADYVTPASVVKLACLLATLVGIALIGARANGSSGSLASPAARRYRLLLMVPAVVLLASGVGFTLAGYALRPPQMQLTRTAIGRAVSALVSGGHDAGAPQTATFDQLLRSSRVDTQTPALHPDHPLVGRTADADLLVFIMETGPGGLLDLASGGRELPGTGALYDRALVATRHYTSHPYSSDAMFSILSGLYPQGRRRLLRGATGSRVNGLLTALSDFPVRSVYVPSLFNLVLDEQMYAVFGADELYAADKHRSDPLRTTAEGRAETVVNSLEQESDAVESRAQLRRRLATDFLLLERVKADITTAVRSGSRYAVIFFPGIGHGPWLAMRNERTVAERGRALMRLQDLWLMELVETIKALGRLDRTVIVFTSDHGVRTRAEDPSLPVGRISADMFHVPLLIYAPQSLSSSMTIDVPTSHVDLAPTILALLGRTAAAADMQGVPIWQRNGRERLYLLGATYGGADGFVEGGTYYMRQTLSGGVYRSDRFIFPDAALVAPTSPIVPFVTGALAGAEHLQHALISRVLFERQVRRPLDRPIGARTDPSERLIARDRSPAEGPSYTSHSRPAR